MNKLLLPLDIILIIIRYYADKSALYKLSTTCRLISPHALSQLWHMPYITTVKSLDRLSTTLSLPSPSYPYKDWIAGLALHMREEENGYGYQNIPKGIFFSLSNLKLEILSLQRINILIKDLSFEHFLQAQLDQGLSELHLYQCTPVTLESTASSIRQKNRIYFRVLCLHDCQVTDSQVENIVQYCPRLQVLRLEQCGCLSDRSMMTIAKSCVELNTLVVTLPSNIFQSNMITVSTIEALETHCLSLKKFVCGGQVRISEYINNNKRSKFSVVVPDISPSWE